MIESKNIEDGIEKIIKKFQKGSKDDLPILDFQFKTFKVIEEMPYIINVKIENAGAVSMKKCKKDKALSTFYSLKVPQKREVFNIIKKHIEKIKEI